MNTVLVPGPSLSSTHTKEVTPTIVFILHRCHTLHHGEIHILQAADSDLIIYLCTITRYYMSRCFLLYFHSDKLWKSKHSINNYFMQLQITEVLH